MKKSLVKHLWSPYETSLTMIQYVQSNIHRLWYLGVKIYSVCVLAGAELQAWVDGMGSAGVISIIVLIIVISISSRRQTHRSSPVCRERGRGLTNISLSIYYWFIIGFHGFIGASVCSSGDAMTSKDIKLQQLLRFIIQSSIFRRYDICSRSL